ncbi:MAG: CocE/NonD family hydrolase [Hyphomicrobiales bacterium]
MTTIRDFSNSITETKNLFIELADGTKLAARMWLPNTADKEPVPALLEYLPYRKRDGTAARDELTHPYFAGNGYACLRVDMRGNGESDGLTHDEYTQQEHDDCVEVIAWIAAQSWCSGNVGMMGISWGGFNGLQVAALQPKALKAIITLCSTDDRYHDDIHYKGGSLLNENLGWAGTMLSFSSRPPDPALVGEKWRDMWMKRLEENPLLTKAWMDQPHRGAYWKHGSVCEDYSDIKAAVLAVGGWGDAYSNAIPRLVENLKCPAKGIIGPWTHTYPHFAAPEPRMGFLQEALRWWDHWLKGEDTGVEDDPAYRTYIMDAAPPHTSYKHRAGRWVAQEGWFGPNIDVLPLRLGNGVLERAPSDEMPDSICSDLTTGRDGGAFCAMWMGPDFPGDQQRDDSLCVCFDTAPAENDMDIFGAPELSFKFASNKPQAQLIARLNDVAPNGAVTRITYGVLNLTHYESHEHPSALTPGKVYSAVLKLDDVAYQLPAGHTLRLSLSSSNWSLIWPSPERATITLQPEECTLNVPVRRELNDAYEPFDPPESAPPLKLEEVSPPSNTRESSQKNGKEILVVTDDAGTYLDTTIGLTTGSKRRERFEIKADDPLSAKAETHWTQTLSRDDGWAVRTEAFQTLSCTSDVFFITARVEAYEGDELVFEKDYHEQVARDLL